MIRSCVQPNVRIMSQKIRIKDIAVKAGVSVGTVDRVLHHRPNVSKEALEKVRKVLKEINYQPNMYASALALNRSYTFCLMMPRHASDAYWDEIEQGVMKACESRRDFLVDIKVIYYQRMHDETFVKACAKCLAGKPDGVIIVPAETEVTRRFTDKLHEQTIPFVLLDSYLPELNPLSFYGQDSLNSGYFAAKMLMLIAARESEIMLMKMTHEGRVSSRQQENRETGFKRYMNEHFPKVKLVELELPLDGRKEQFNRLLEQFFAEYPQVRHGITFCSKAHLVGEYLLANKLTHFRMMGYDSVPQNVECLREGSISFLIVQHAFMQGLYSFEALFRSIVLKRQVKPVNYMPIELLCKENVDFYQKTLI